MIPSGRAWAQALVTLAHHAPEGSCGWLIEEISGAPAASDPASAFLLAAGFAATAMGLQLRVSRLVRCFLLVSQAFTTWVVRQMRSEQREQSSDSIQEPVTRPARRPVPDPQA